MMSKQESESIFYNILHPKKRAYLSALIESGGNKFKATQLAGIHFTTPYTSQWRDDEEFQEALLIAEPAAADRAEAEAIRRAIDGVEEPVGWFRGVAGGTVTRYSDTLLIFLMKGNNPQKYAEFHKHSGSDGPPIKMAVTVTRTIIEPDATED